MINTQLPISSLVKTMIQMDRQWVKPAGMNTPLHQMGQASHLGSSRWAFPNLKIAVKVLLVPWEENPLAWMGQEIVSELLSLKPYDFSLSSLVIGCSYMKCTFNIYSVRCSFLLRKFSLQASGPTININIEKFLKHNTRHKCPKLWMSSFIFRAPLN